MSERRLDAHAVERSKTQGKERIPPDQQRLTIAGQQPEMMKDDTYRRATTLTNRALDELSSVPRDDSLELFTGTDAKPSADASSG